MIGKTYDQIRPPRAEACPLFIMKDPKPFVLPPPRPLIACQVHENNGRESHFLDARIKTGFWLWSRWEDVKLLGVGRK